MRWIKATIAGLAAMTGTIASPRFARSRLRRKCLAIAGVLALTGVSVALPSTAFAAGAGGRNVRTTAVPAGKFVPKGGAITPRVRQIPPLGNIVNVNTGGCIDDSFTYGLRSFKCSTLSYQQWGLTLQSDGSYTFQNQNTGRCIDDSFAYHLRSFPCNNLNYQNWWVTTVYNLNGTSWFQIKNANTGGCIDDSFTYHLRSFPCNQRSYQLWLGL